MYWWILLMIVQNEVGYQTYFLIKIYCNFKCSFAFDRQHRICLHLYFLLHEEHRCWKSTSIHPNYSGYVVRHIYLDALLGRLNRAVALSQCVHIGPHALGRHAPAQRTYHLLLQMRFLWAVGWWSEQSSFTLGPVTWPLPPNNSKSASWKQSAVTTTCHYFGGGDLQECPALGRTVPRSRGPWPTTLLTSVGLVSWHNHCKVLLLQCYKRKKWWSCFHSKESKNSIFLCYR